MGMATGKCGTCKECGQDLVFEKEHQCPANKDPWAHRSEGMRCKTCMWFVEKANPERDVTPYWRRIGRCRRHAPTMNGYPVVYPDDWCGDHKLNEKAVGRE